MLKNTFLILLCCFIYFTKAQSDIKITYTKNCDTLKNYYNDTLMKKADGQFTCPLKEKSIFFNTDIQFKEYLIKNGKSVMDCLGDNLTIDFNNSMLFILRINSWGCSEPNIKLKRLNTKDPILKLNVLVNGNCAALQRITCFFVLPKENISEVIVCED